MKRTITLCLLLIAGIVAFSGCKKKNDSAPSYQMAANISGNPSFSGTNCWAMYQSYPQDSTYFIYGSAVDQNGKAIYPDISIWVYTYHGVGTYDGSAFGIIYETSATSTNGGGNLNSQTLTITSVSSTAVSGTFSFSELLNNSSVTVSGSFTAKVQ